MPVIAQQDPDPPTQRELFGSAAQLWLILAVLGVLVVCMAGLVLYRHHRRTRELLETPRRRAPIPDAWEEAGRRLEPPADPGDGDGEP